MRNRKQNKRQNKKDMKGLLIYLLSLILWAYLLIDVLVGGAL